MDYRYQQGYTNGWRKARDEADAEVKTLEAEIERLQRIIDSRPAINAALPESYIRWSQSIYTTDMATASTRQ